jgi:alpha-tubulin suppressor-like RCC1 family protein
MLGTKSRDLANRVVFAALVALAAFVIVTLAAALGAPLSEMTFARAQAQEPLLDEIVQIASGENYTCALTEGGGVKCWGDNGFGQLGDGTVTQRLAPVNVLGLTSGVTAIAAGWEHTCALMEGALSSAGGAMSPANWATGRPARDIPRIMSRA